MQNEKYIEALAAGRYAFIDLGCGSGGSIDHCVRRFRRGKGLGFELDPKEASEAVRDGYDVVEGDVLSVQPPAQSVGFVSAMDFLEHLPNISAADLVLKKFGPAAREFLFIRHPSFEEMEYLHSLGLKLCWTDWTGHPNGMRLNELLGLLEQLQPTEYAIFPRGLMTDESDDQIVPISAPTDTLIYDPNVLDPKPQVRFDRPIFAQYDIFLRFGNGLNDEQWQEIIWADVAQDAPVWATRFVAATQTNNRPVRTGIGFYDSDASRWQMKPPGADELIVKYGAERRGWLPFAGTFQAGKIGLGLYDPTTADFFIRHSTDEGLADVTTRFGAPGGIPIAGDWTGSGVDTLGVYIPATGQWYLRYSNSDGPADEAFSYGPEGTNWLPVVGDWDGDGRDSIGLYEPATGSWHLRGAGPEASDADFTFGPPGAVPMAGDWNGSGRDSIGVYQPDWGLWVLRNEHSNGPADATFVYRGKGSPVVFPLP